MGIDTPAGMEVAPGVARSAPGCVTGCAGGGTSGGRPVVDTLTLPVNQVPSPVPGAESTAKLVPDRIGC